MKTRIEGGFLVRDERPWPTRDADPGPIVYPMPSRPATPEPNTSDPPEWRREAPDRTMQMGGYASYEVDVPGAVEYRSSREPPSGQTAREAAARADADRQGSFAVYMGGSGDGEKKCLCDLQKAFDRHWGARPPRTRDQEGRLMREVARFDELDDSGTAECNSEHDEATYQLRRETPGYSLHREVDDDERLQDPPMQDWIRPRVRGQANDGKRSDTGRQMADIKKWQKQLDAHNRNRVL
jgi:hypothetical protein